VFIKEVDVVDKYEYNLRNEEINALIGRREYKKAVAIADGIDWTKVRSVKTLCKISDLYKVNKRYNESRILLEQALNRCPSGKSIVSSLCELCIRMGDVVGSTEYYKQFVEMAPTDNLKFVLLYKMYEAQEATLDERIEVLEELKKRERIEKWCYELAYLYHRIGLTTRCVEECDDLILWFREGRYVKKAMELKMLHQQLTQSQEVLYQNMLDPTERMAYVSQTTVNQVQPEMVPDQEDVLVKTVDVGQYSTINIQKALEESIKVTLGTEKLQDTEVITEAPVNIEQVPDSTMFITDPNSDEDVKLSRNIVAEQLLAPMMQDTGEMTELFFNSDTGEIELDDTGDIPKSEIQTAVNNASIEEDNGNLPETETADNNSNIADEIVFPDIPVRPDTLVYNKGDAIKPLTEEKTYAEPAPVIDISNASKEDLMAIIDRKVKEALENAMKGQSMIPVNQPVYRAESLSHVTPPRSMEKMLSQEPNGQLSLVVPEEEEVEKQITGQINLEEYLASWEDSKKNTQAKQEEEIKQIVAQETGSLLNDFEAKARDSILEKLANEDKDTPVDADKEYEEYLQKIMAADEADRNAKEIVPTEEDVQTTEEAAEEAAETVETVEDVEEEEFPEVEEICEIEEESEEEPTEEHTEESQKEPEKETDSLSDINSGEILQESDSENSEEDTEEKSDDSSDKEVEEKSDDSSYKEDQNTEPSDDSLKLDNDTVAATDSDDEGRPLTDEELTLFAQFVQTKKAKQNLSKALDSISLASYTGNVFVTGDMGEESVALSQSVVKYAKMTDGNFSGKIGKVTGSSLNGKDVAATVERLLNGGLIIEKAGEMNAETVKSLIKVLNKDNTGILVVMQDTRKEMNKMMSHFDGMRQMFNVHIEIEELSDDALVAYGRKYAEHMEYAIDEMGILALHTRIDEMQTSDHIVTVADVREIVDEAIENATRFSPKHITDVLFGKRYDDEDMIILKERDFTS